MFGSTGGGDGFAFDTRTSPYRVMQVPFVGMSVAEKFLVAGSFTELLDAMQETEVPSSQLPNKVKWPGQEIFEITPVLLGGNPTDPENKTVLTRDQHMEVVRCGTNKRADRSGCHWDCAFVARSSPPLDESLWLGVFAKLKLVVCAPISDLSGVGFLCVPAAVSPLTIWECAPNDSRQLSKAPGRALPVQLVHGSRPP